MKDTSKLGDLKYRGILARHYSAASADRIIERRLARLQGFVIGMVVMAALILYVGAYCWGA